MSTIEPNDPLSTQNIVNLSKLAEGGEEAIVKLLKKMQDVRTEAAATAGETKDLVAALGDAQTKKEQILTKIAQARKDGDTALLEEQQKLLASQRQYLSSLNELSDAAEKYGIKLDDLSKDSFENFIARMEEGKKMTDELGNAMGELADFIPVVGDQLKKLTRIKGLATRGFDNLSKVLTHLASDKGPGGKIGEWASKMNVRITNLSSKIASFSGAVMVGAAALVAIGVYAVATALKFDKLEAGFRKQIDGAEDLDHQLTNLTYRMTEVGVSAQDLANSTQGLLDSFSGFNIQNKKANERLIITTSKMEKLGVATGESAGLMDFFNRSVGMSSDRSADAAAKISLMGRAISVSSAKMVKDFTAASGRLSIYGDKAIDVFQGLAAQAKASGIEIQTLLGITQKFDAFDTAADSVAQLNAVIGTNLSAVEMLAANDEQRINMLREQVKLSVGNFDSMDKFTKMYVAQAMGVKDVAEAQRLLNMSTAEYQKYKSGQQESINAQEDLNKAVIAAMPLGTKLLTILTSMLKVFEPLITGVGAFFELIALGIDKVREFTASNTELSKVWYVISYILKGAVVVALTVFLAKLIGISAVITGVVVGIFSLAGAIKEFFFSATLQGSPYAYQMAGVFAKGFETMGDAAARAGEMMKSPIKSLKGMWDEFHRPGSPELYKLPAEFAANFASIEQSIQGSLGSITKFISTMREFAELDFDGFIAIRTEGGSTSMVMGSEDVITSLSKGKLTVDVKMPEMKMPEINVQVYIGDTELRNIVRSEVKYVVGNA